MISTLPQQFVHREELDPKLQITFQNMWEELVLAINGLITTSVGLTQGTLNPDTRPTGFTSGDAYKQMFLATDYNHMYVWDGTEWDVVEDTSGQVVWYTVQPTGSGWQLCDGSAGVMQSDSHGALSSITVPDLITNHPYIRGGNAYSGPTSQAAVVPTISSPSDTGAGGAHTHTVVPLGTLTGSVTATLPDHVHNPTNTFTGPAKTGGGSDWVVTGTVSGSTDNGDLNPGASVDDGTVVGTIESNPSDCTNDVTYGGEFGPVDLQNCGHTHPFNLTLNFTNVSGTWTHSHAVSGAFTDTSVAHYHIVDFPTGGVDGLPIAITVTNTLAFSGSSSTTSAASPSTHTHPIGSITATSAGEPTHMTLIPMFRL